MSGWAALADRLGAASGADHELDRAIAEAFRQPPRPYTGSVEDCRALVAAALPGWVLHLGFDVRGVFPYAALTRGATHLEAEAASLPLAIVMAAVKASQAPAPSPAPSAPPEA